MQKKILSLCIPTYNRGWCVKEQIIRLNSCPKEILNKIEILISDNCSTDDTKKIVGEAIENGFSCKYIRNDINLGMDGNFVSCCRHAQGRYLWILGDDDIIIIDSLVRIVNLLASSEEYDLLHIYQKNDLQCDIFAIKDRSKIAKYIGYHITFISANIVNAKYISMIDFEKYIGTLFVLVPLYLTAIINSQTSVFVSIKTFESGRDWGREEYNFFEIFVENYLSIVNEYIKEKKLFSWFKKDIWIFVWQYTIKLLIKKDCGNFKTEKGWMILFKYYGCEWCFWWSLIKYPFSVIKRKINKIR